MATQHDSHGQPANSAFNQKRRSGRELDELLGLCKGILADGVVNQSEAEFLAQWLRLNREASELWPANVLFERIQSMLSDGRLEKDEERELLGLLIEVTGGNAARLDAHSLSTGLPVTVPAPEIFIPGKRFCLSGKFIFGPRNKCKNEIEKRKGIVADDVSVDLNFLVIGLVGSRDWAHSSFGRKIEKAMEYREKGYPLAIVTEEQFIGALAKQLPGSL